MKNKKNAYMPATQEMVDYFIEEQYAAHCRKIDMFLKDYATSNQTEIDVTKIVEDLVSERNNLAANISYYENELVRMLDLATVLSEYKNKNKEENVDKYIGYLLEKNKEILPEIIELIQLLKK